MKKIYFSLVLPVFFSLQSLKSKTDNEKIRDLFTQCLTVNEYPKSSNSARTELGQELFYARCNGSNKYYNSDLYKSETFSIVDLSDRASKSIFIHAEDEQLKRIKLKYDDSKYKNKNSSLFKNSNFNKDNLLKLKKENPALYIHALSAISWTLDNYYIQSISNEVVDFIKEELKKTEPA